MRYVEKYGRAGQDTDGNIVQAHAHFTLQTHTRNVSNSISTTTMVTRYNTLPVLFHIYVLQYQMSIKQ